MSTLGAHRAQVDSASPTRETAHVACWVVRLLVLVDAAVATVLIGTVRLYQLLVSPLLGPVCRYAPSCSSYGAQALAGHGAVRGSALTLWRVARCHPWSSGGWDPVPPGRTPSWRQECRHERRRHAPRPSSRPPAACEHQPSPEPARTP